MQWVWIWSVIGELRSHMPCDVAKRHKNNNIWSKILKKEMFRTRSHVPSCDLLPGWHLQAHSPLLAYEDYQNSVQRGRREGNVGILCLLLVLVPRHSQEMTQELHPPESCQGPSMYTTCWGTRKGGGCLAANTPWVCHRATVQGPTQLSCNHWPHFQQKLWLEPEIPGLGPCFSPQTLGPFQIHFICRLPRTRTRLLIRYY